MSTKRPMIKFKDKHGKVKVKKMSASYYVDKIWPTFKELYLEIVYDIANGKYTEDDIVDIVFDHKEIKRERRNKHEVIE